MENKSIAVRYAKEQELGQVNELRKMVNEVHVNGRPDIFRPGFCEELKNHIYDIFRSENADVIVALMEEKICGFAVAEYIDRPVSPYNLARSFYHIEEFGVVRECRRMGVATALMEFMKKEAVSKGYQKIELDVWAFNEEAMEFYNASGFQTYRRLMELVLPD